MCDAENCRWWVSLIHRRAPLKAQNAGQHNLGILPTIQIWEESTFGDMKFVSLYDPRIDSIETSGANELKLSFVSAFKGFIQLAALSEPIDYQELLEVFLPTLC